MIKKNEFSSQNFIIILIISLLLIEIFATIQLEVFDQPHTRVVGYFKLVFQLILLYNISFFRIPKSYLYSIIFLTLIFTSNQTLLSPNSFDNIYFSFSIGAFYYFDRLIYVFFFIAALYWFKEKKIIFAKSVNIISKILFVNAVFIVLGALFDISFFKSYAGSSRFGYDGIFNKVNEVHFLYMIYISNLYFKIINQQNKKVEFLFIVFSSLLLGTKTMILFNVLLLVFHLTVNVKRKLLFRKGFIIIGVIGLFFYKHILKFIFDSSLFWFELSKKYDVVTLLFSTRNLRLQTNLEYIQANWNLSNYFIGGPFYTDSFIMTEMDFLDIFIFFGFIGAFVFLFSIFKLFSSNSKILNGLSLIILFCGLLSGGLFFSVLVMIYMYLSIRTLDGSIKRREW